MLPQSQCSRHANRVHRAARALMLLLPCAARHAAANLGRVPATQFGDRQDMRACLAGSHGHTPLLLPSDPLGTRPVGADSNASRRQPIEELRLHVPAQHAFGVRRNARADDDDGARPAAALALCWQDGPEWQRTVRSFRRGGTPLVRFRQSSHAVAGLGVSRHGIAGIYLTKTLSE